MLLLNCGLTQDEAACCVKFIGFTMIKVMMITITTKTTTTTIIIIMIIIILIIII